MTQTNKMDALGRLPSEELRKKAEAGDVDAQLILGSRYADGYLSAPKDEAEAAKWYVKAAEHGDASIQLLLALLYKSGRGVPKDSAGAAKWFRKAAEQGEPTAQYYLGVCYERGEGVTKDDAEAVRWYRKAAEQGDAEAQFELGKCYRSGLGVETNLTEAVRWLGKAGDQGNASAQFILAASYESGVFGETNLTEAVKWFRKAAEQGDADAQSSLGLYYALGYGLAQDYAEAVKWLRKAAEQGIAVAQETLGLCYAQGQGVTKDDQEAVKWYRKAAEQGIASAQYNLGVCYAEGEGVPLDYVEAYKWYNLAASYGDKEAVANRDLLSQEMTREQIAEGQRRASRFVARPNKRAGDGSTPQPGTAAVPVRSGTGFLIAVSKNPCVLTAQHVVKDAKSIKVVLGGKTFTARVVGADPANDVALLQITVAGNAALSQTALPITASRQVKLGDSVLTIGFPNTDVQGVTPKLTRGEINSLAGIQDDPRYFQTSVAVQPGNSGGPLVDMHGNVIGVVTMRLDDLKTLELTGSLPQNVNYGLKSAFVLAFLDSVTGLAASLPPPHTEDRKFEDVVKEVQQATVRVLTY